MRFYLFDNLKSRRRITYDLFLRLIGFVYFCAFYSCASQLDGLYGDQGIVPVREFLALVQLANGDFSWLACPTLLWFCPTPGALSGMAVAGSVISILLMAGILPWLCTAFLYLLYLSIISVGQEFLS